MKEFEVYKHIRKRAMLMGLPVALFALMMTLVIASLLLIIFSFRFSVIIAVCLINIGLYLTLTHVTKNPSLLHFRRVFPKAISTKKTSHLHYE